MIAHNCKALTAKVSGIFLKTVVHLQGNVSISVKTRAIESPKMYHCSPSSLCFPSFPSPQHLFSKL